MRTDATKAQLRVKARQAIRSETSTAANPSENEMAQDENEAYALLVDGLRIIMQILVDNMDIDKGRKRDVQEWYDKVERMIE